jgi:hypothetical protein
VRRVPGLCRGCAWPLAPPPSFVEGTCGLWPLLRLYVFTVDAMCFLHDPPSERDTPRRGSFFLFTGAMRPARGPPSCDRRDTPRAQSAVPLSSARCAPRVVRCVSSSCVGVMRSARSACRLLGAMRSMRGPPGVCFWGGGVVVLGRVPGVLSLAVHVCLPCFSHGAVIVGVLGFWVGTWSPLHDYHFALEITTYLMKTLALRTAG